jgi:putative DNA primase/helicase
VVEKPGQSFNETANATNGHGNGFRGARTQALGTNAIKFLQLLRPDGPWVLTAIIPDGGTCTATFTDPEAARKFIAHQVKQEKNLYYTINPCRTVMEVKPKKSDIAAAEYLYVDVDPAKDETPEEFKTGILPVIESFRPEPSFIVDSGNGIQALWRLEQQVALDDPGIAVEVEARNHALAEQLGADASTRNIDRLFRLPGTINYPNRAKRKLGRTKCRAKLIKSEPLSHRLSAFPPKQAAGAKEKGQEQSTGSEILAQNVAALLYVPGNGSYKTRSEMLFAFLIGALRADIADDVIINACLDSEYESGGIHEHVKENGGRSYLQRQLDKARAELTNKPGRQLTTRSVDQFQHIELEWMWWPFVPQGMVTLIFGEGGVGKSTITLDMAARMSRGRLMPDFGGESNSTAPASVLILTKEDDVSRIIRPRLEAARADLTRVHMVGHRDHNDPAQFSPIQQLDSNLAQLESEIVRLGDVKLVIIDPVTDFSGKLDLYRDSDIRTLLTPLNRLAARHDLSIIILVHINKKEDQRARYRAMGGVGFINVPRSAVLVTPDPDDAERKLMVQVKQNLLGGSERAAAFGMQSVRGYAKIKWEPELFTASADELLTKSTKKAKKQEAIDLLRKWLAKKPLSATQLQKRAMEAGIGWRTVKAAKEEAGVESYRVRKSWYWRIRETQSQRKRASS